MKVLFEFPRRNFQSDLGEINKFLKESSLSGNRVRKFGVYLKDTTRTHSKDTSVLKYQLKFKFFDEDGKEIKDYTFKIDQGYFDLKDEASEKALIRLKRETSTMSQVASLDLKDAKFGIDDDLLTISIEIEDKYTSLNIVFPNN